METMSSRTDSLARHVLNVSSYPTRVEDFELEGDG
jgi:hypothetical protein